MSWILGKSTSGAAGTALGAGGLGSNDDGSGIGSGGIDSSGAGEAGRGAISASVIGSITCPPQQLVTTPQQEPHPQL
jgi:hypothetical protein